MKNKDVLNTAQLEIAQRISNAAKEGNTDAFEEGLKDLFLSIQNQIIDEAAKVKGSADATILASRGIRQLTNEETTFYENFIEKAKAVGTSKAVMALTEADATFPITIVNATMDDMVQDHPLLSAVDTMTVTGLTKILINTDSGQAATWGQITAAIAEELTSGFKEIDLSQNKVSAFLPISNAMLDLGPVWLDSYIRTCLSEALALGFETAIVTGTGKDMPIGMDRSVADDVTVTGGVYPQKDKVAVTDFGRASYGALVAKLAKTQYGKPRAVAGLILVVNPEDYFSVVMPATTAYTPEGHYVNDVLPVPTQIIQSVAVAKGEALLGLGKRYFLGIAGSKGVQFSDEYKWIDDQRYYKIVAYANGRPKDNNAFLRLDISKLEPLYLEVKQISTTA